MEINYLALLVAGISNMAVGFAWFGPVFGKSWMKLMNFSEDHIKAEQEKGMGSTYFLAFVGALIGAFVMNWLIELSGAVDVMGALKTAGMAWLGFVATVFLGMVLWEGRSWKLYALNVGYYLVVFVIQALILTYWV